ncbi:MAG: DUF4838 domain-containing protein [Nitrospirae bacterium]|nr:DUF4838 domain-containing protein [Nitrospirota bacterium]
MNRKLIIIALLLIPVFSTFSFSHASGVKPVRGVSSGGGTGELKAIILPATPTRWEALAEKELQNYLKKITGKNLTVYKDGQGRLSKGNIYLGKAALDAGLIGKEDLKKIKFDGYIVVSKGGNVGIFGDKGAGVIYGVYGFLNKLGVKIYAQGVEILPSATRIIVPEFSLVRNPAFEFRFVRSGFGWVEKISGFATTRLGFSAHFLEEQLSVFPEATWADPKIKKVQVGHTSRYLCPPYLYLKSHPEYYAHDKSGKLKPFTNNWVHLTLSNPEVRKIATRRVLEWIDKFPEGKFFVVTQGDGPGWDEYKDRVLDSGPVVMKGKYPAYLTDRWLNFIKPIARAVAKKYPDKLILTFAYTPATQSPPIREKVPSNVRILLAPYVTPGGAKCHDHDLFCPLNKEFLPDFEGWLKVAPENIYMFDYAMNFKNRYSPFFPLDAMNKKLKFYYSRGIRGIRYCGSPRLFGDLFLYVQGKLLWNPGLDPEKLENEFLGIYYGKAAGQMKEFLTLIRSRIYDKKNPVHEGIYSRANELINADYAKKAYRIFKKAEAAVKDNPQIYARVEFEKFTGVLWSDLDQYVTRDKMERFLKLKEMVEIARERKMSRSFIARISMPEWFSDKFGMKINPGKDVPWYDAPILKELTSYDRSNMGKFIRKIEASQPKKVRQANKKNEIDLLLPGFDLYGAAFGPKRYSYQVPPKVAIGVYGKESMETVFILDKMSKKDAFLVLSGLDDDKPGVTPIQILLNGKEVFKGPNQAGETNWTELKYRIPERYLRKGKNTLTINDLEAPGPQGNWFFISEAKIIFTDRER